MTAIGAANASPWDQPVGIVLIVVAVIVAVAFLYGAVRDAHRARVAERRWLREAARARAQAQDMSRGAAPGLLCGSIGCPRIGEHFVRDRWVCTKCMEELDARDPRRQYPFDQEAAAGVDEAERWANHHRRGDAS